MVADPVLSLFARVPRPGRVKTRLIPAIGVEGATELHEAMLRDALDRLRDRLDHGGPADVWFDAPPPPEWRDEARRRRLPVGVQSGRNLGDRMARAVVNALEGGHPAAILWGADAPTAPLASLLEAGNAAATTRGAAVVPAADGGYVAFAAARDPEPLFRAVEWGGPDVLRTTREAARREGWSWHETRPWFDLDRIDDLRRLLRDRGDGSPETRAPRTLEACGRWLPRGTP